MADKRICPNCKKELDSGARMNMRFCSSKCRTRYNSVRYYHKVKDTPEFKKYRREYFKGWISRNPEKYHALMRKASLKYRDKQKVQEKK